METHNAATSTAAPNGDGNPATATADDDEETLLLAELSDDDQLVLLRHDSEFSVGSNYDAHSLNNLNMIQGAILLTADCMGTGLLALPGDIQVLGVGLGIGFLVANGPINLFAGTILSYAASAVERRQNAENRMFTNNNKAGGPTTATSDERETDGSDNHSNANGCSSIPNHITSYQAINNEPTAEDAREANHANLHHDTATFDFIGMTQALFHQRHATRWVMFVYYVNIFLVLGNYILVMSHAVSAALGDDWICLPIAGLLASTGMFVVSQTRTMAKLGRAASFVSLAAIAVVVVQCLWASRHRTPAMIEEHKAAYADTNVLRKLSATGSIGFAMGSQKLFLNIRHELADRSVAPKSLAISLTIFVTVYVLIIVLAGPNPPTFLFNAIPPGWNRRVAGLLLWMHVVVSYAINSQAICSSMDRLFWHRLRLPGQHNPALRWMTLTALMATTAYTVSNAVPFFKDLVALIGALTAVPLTLLLPAVFWRRAIHVPVFWPTLDSLWSYALLAFSSVFMVVATVGAIFSIEADWQALRTPFACH